MDSLPVDEALPRLKEALAGRNAAVLVAPPGAGKTTRVPLALLDAPWLGGRKIVMQEPRRLAARAAARRMAATLGEAVGETVGYRVRFDSKVGPRTRIEVVTDGLFLRMLQDDPSLDGIGCVIFDELHERGLETDLSFALVREAQTALREDLRVVAMSATLDPGPVAERLGGAPVIESAGRMFPVETRHLDREAAGRIEDTVAAAIRRALAEESGSALVFLPGVGEIRRVEERLKGLGPAIDVAPLYGDLSPADQDRAIAPSPAGRRKVVLATSIAETSLTIEGVRIVIDCGLMRVPRFSPRSGMTRLETVRVSQASADQRRGRAGRLEPGVCYRLWTEEAAARAAALHAAGDPRCRPGAARARAGGVGRGRCREPALADAAAGRIARHGARAAGSISARSTASGAITPHGRAMARLGQHPRLAHLVLKGRELGQGKVAALLAAILGERDFLRLPPGQRDVDLRHRVDIALSAATAPRLIQEAARRLMPRDARDETPDAVDDRRPAGARLSRPHRPPPRRRRRDATCCRAAAAPPCRKAIRWPTRSSWSWPISTARPRTRASSSRRRHRRPRSRSSTPSASSTEEVVQWSARDGAVLARRRRRLGALLLEDKPLAEARCRSS